MRRTEPRDTMYRMWKQCAHPMCLAIQGTVCCTGQESMCPYVGARHIDQQNKCRASSLNVLRTSEELFNFQPTERLL